MAVGEWDERQLCPDGGCIGVIGPDGHCKVCGRVAPNWGDERNRGLNPPDDADDTDEDDDDDEDDDLDDDEEDRDGDDEDEDEDEDDDDLDDDDDDLDDDEVAAASQPGATRTRGEWSGRELCPNGGCIGVIGPDGHCRVCGLAAVAALADDDASIASTDATEASDGASAASAATGAPSDAPADREHCPDASCSGSIGANGRCEVCGKGAS